MYDLGLPKLVLIEHLISKYASIFGLRVGLLDGKYHIVPDDKETHKTAKVTLIAHEDLAVHEDSYVCILCLQSHNYTKYKCLLAKNIRCFCTL